MEAAESTEGNGRLELGVLAGVVGADACFYDAPLGWLAGPYALAVAVTLLGGAGVRAGSAAAQATLSAAALVTAALLVVEPSPLALALAATGLAVLATIARAGFSDRPEVWLERARRMLRPSTAAAFSRHAAERLRLRRRPAARPARERAPLDASLGRALAWLRGWALPLGLGAVFLALFSAANPLFEEAMREGVRVAWEEVLDIAALLSPLRWLFWLVTASALWALLLAPVRGRGPTKELSLLPEAERVERWTEGPVLLRCLALLNALFAAQNLLDLRYLWGGAELPAGLTHAEYAHRGAYPLVGTTLLAAALVLIAFRPGRAHGGGRTTRALVVAWIAQNVLLTASAAARLELYVEAYGLTRLRFAAALWMALVGFGLASIAWRILSGRSNTWLVRVNVAALVALLYGAAFANADARIAWWNVRHASEITAGGRALDLRYVEGLGFEAIRPLEWFGHYAADRAQARRARDAAGRLRTALAERTADGRGLTIRRALAAREVSIPAD